MRIFLSGMITCLFLGYSRAAEELQAAKLVSFTNNVLLRRTGSSDWGKAIPKMDLFVSDTIYTMAASRAEIRFHTGELLALAPNTLVVLRPPGKKGADVEMLAGGLLSRRSRIITRSAAILPKTADAEFSARMKEDLTTVVSVTRGMAEVEAQGRKVEVRMGYVTEVRPDMAPSPPVKLARFPLEPGAASAHEPGKAGKKPDTDLVINKTISAGKTIKGFHLQVSKARDFTAKVLNKTYAASEKMEINKLLPPGEYFVRVALIDLLGFEGRFSAHRRIKVSGSKSEIPPSGTEPFGETSIYDFNYNNIGREREGELGDLVAE